MGWLSSPMHLSKRDSRWLAAWFVLLGLFQTWPAFLGERGGLLAHPKGDGPKHLWTLWWMRRSLLEEVRFPFSTRLVNFPDGMDLYPIELLNGLFVSLFGFLDLVDAANLAVLCNLALTGWCGAWMAGQLGSGLWGRLVAGTGIQMSAVMAHFVAIGVGELQHLWWIPLGIGWSARVRRQGGWASQAGLGVILAAATLSCFYIGFFLGIGVGCIALVGLVLERHRLRNLVGQAWALFVLLVFLVPITAVFSGSYGADGRPAVSLTEWVFGEACQPILDSVDTRLEVRNLVRPLGWANDPPSSVYIGGTFLGWGVLALGFLGMLRRPRVAAGLVVTFCVGILFALGSYWSEDGNELIYRAHRIRLPLLWLNRALGWFAEPINFPVRFVALSQVALAGLAGLAMPEKRARTTAMVGGILVFWLAGETTWFGQSPWPWPQLLPRESVAAKQLAGLPAGGVVDLSMAMRDDARNRRSGLYLQLVHEQPTQTVPIERVEFFARSGQNAVAALGLVGALRKIEGRQGASLSGDFSDDLAMLYELGFRYLVFSENQTAAGAVMPIVGQLRPLLGEPLAMADGVAVWSLPKPAQAVSSGAWAAHRQRVAQLEAALRPEGRAGSMRAVSGPESRGESRVCMEQSVTRGTALAEALKKIPFRDHQGPWLELKGRVEAPDSQGEVFLELFVPDPRAREGWGSAGIVRLPRPGRFELRVPMGLGPLRIKARQELSDGPVGSHEPVGLVEVAVSGEELEELLVQLKGVGGR